MNVADFLQQRFPGGLQGLKIRTYLSAQTKPEYQLLRSLIIRHNGEDTDSNFEIPRVVAACKALGITTDSDLNAFATYPLGFLEGIQRVTEGAYPRFPWERDMRVETNKQDILRAVQHGAFPLQPDFRFDLRYFQDAYYRVLPVGVNCLRDLLSQSRVPNYGFIPENRDCDDFAVMLMAELAQAGRGSYAIGEMSVSCYDAAGTMVYRHALNFSAHEPALPSEHLDLYLIDPQSGAIWNRPEFTPVLHPQQDHIKVDLVRV